MSVYYSDDSVTLYHGDCLDVLAELPDASVEAVVTDPPYGIAFMGKQWDQPGEFGSTRRSTGLNHKRGHKDAALEAGKYDLSPAALANFQRWCEAWATECLRILRPGGHLLAFGGSRTWHRLTAGIEDAGFEIRDSIAWLYGSGFPKSLNVAKAIASGSGRPEDIRRLNLGEDYAPSGRGRVNYDHGAASAMGGERVDVDVPPEAEQWQGWGTALKPAFEPIVVARKPLTGTVAGNVLAHGTGALNIDGCRIGTSGGTAKADTEATTESVTAYGNGLNGGGVVGIDTGRWPANVVLDESQADALDAQSGTLTSGTLAAHHQRAPKAEGILGAYGSAEGERGYGDTGGASRFFYTAKAGQDERPRVEGVAHPTVKPLDLMRWLVRLVTPPGGTVLEPFAGSGTTAEACVVEGFKCIAIEREPDYLPLIVQRLSKPIQVALI